MPDREKVISELFKFREEMRTCNSTTYVIASKKVRRMDLIDKTIALLKAQEQRHRLEVHNIGNVDIPENVTEKQFHAVMNNVVAALEHTDKGESWPYDEDRR